MIYSLGWFLLRWGQAGQLGGWKGGYDGEKRGGLDLVIGF